MTEIVVVGAGPAGVAAAVTAAQAGAKVTLIEESARPGGQYFKQPRADLDPDHFPPSLADNIRQGRDLLAGLNQPNLELRCNTLAWNVTPDRKLSLYPLNAASADEIQAQRLIIAAGAYERVMPFPGWTLPGVMTVGGAQLLLKGQGLLTGRRRLLAGTGPLLQLAGVQLLEAGAEIAAIVELQPQKKFLSLAPKLWGHWGKVGQGLTNRRRLQQAGVPLKFGYAVVRALGEREVEEAVIARVDDAGRPIAGKEERLVVDTICLNFGFVPATELTRLAGCEQRFDPYFGALATVTNETMETSQPGIFAVGEVRGIGGVEVALLEGRIAGAAAAQQLGYQVDETAHSSAALRKEWQRARSVVETLGTMFSIKPGLCALASDDVVVCRCEEVTAGAVRAAVRAGATHLNQLKPWARAGMGRCQGRVCGPIVAHLVAQETGWDLAAVGTFTARPPVKPIPMGVIVGPDKPAEPELQWEDHVTQYGQVRRS
ncbi:MAG: (2Fe-2S)-binding protein [Chloroflexota bacterium]|nr:MAG: (2Fe-2S)-binding protein [Chloroflexota bacterium]